MLPRAFQPWRVRRTFRPLLVLFPLAAALLPLLLASPAPTPTLTPAAPAEEVAQARISRERPPPAEAVQAPREGPPQSAADAVRAAARNLKLLREDLLRRLPAKAAPEQVDALLSKQAAGFLYLSFHNLPRGDRGNAWKALANHVNAVAGKGVSDITSPVLILEDGSEKHWPHVLRRDWEALLLARVDVRDYHWPDDLRDKLAEQGFYFSVPVQEAEPPRYEKVLFDKHRYWPDENGIFWVGDTRPNVPEARRWVKASEWKDGDYWLRPVGGERKAAGKVEFREGFWIKKDAETAAALAQLQHATGQRFPVQRADNFIWQTAAQQGRVVGYYGIQGLRSRDDFFRLIGFRQDESLDYSDEFLINVALSGVAESNARRMGRFRRMVWTTFDNEVAVDKVNPLRVLDNKNFTHKAEEHLGFAPSGFWKAYLSDDKGVQQNVAPPFVGFDRTSPENDGNIHPYIGCIRCHEQMGENGLARFNHWQQNLNKVRPGWEPQTPLAVADEGLFLQLRRQYLQGLEFWFKRDGQMYAYAVRRASGQTPGEFAGSLSKVWADYVAPVTMERAARELGVTPEKFREALVRYKRTTGSLDPVLDEFTLPRKEQQAIGYAQWQEVYFQAELAVAGLAPADAAK